MKTKPRLNKKKIIIISSIIIVTLLISVALFITITNKNTTQTTKKENTTTKVKEEKLKIVDLDSKTRPIAIMINNNHAAWPQSGLKEAYIIYELMVEGGITRMMALYRDANTEKIGSIRSARIYYLDYVLENDAIYAHFGGSDDAYSDIKTLGINDIDGITTSSAFWRDKSLNRASEHTAFTKTSLITEAANKKKYRMTSDKDLLLNYSIKEIDSSKLENATSATHIDIKYSNYQTSTYDYDTENKVYKRTMNNVKHTDLVTKEQYTFKNIIIYNVPYSSYDSYGRQKINNTGNGTGYYITNGYSIPITWEKSSRSSQTIYKYKDGKEITVNDGNTFIQIYPNSGKLTIN